MKRYFYILILFLFSCDELLEQSGPLSYETLIAEGWSYFIDGNYNMSEELFSEVLDIDPSFVPYYSEAFLGLGWSNLYNAKNLLGASVDDFYQRLALRDSAHVLLMLAYDEISEYSGNENDELFLLNLKPDLYAGLSYAISSLILYEDYYGDEADELVNNALSYSDSLLALEPDYFFTYDSSNINANSIHLLRAQLYLEIDEYDLAEQEISLIELESTDVQFNVEHEYDNSTYDLFLYVGFQGQEKHLFQMDSINDTTSQVSRSFTSLLPCVDLIVDDIDLSNNEIVECLSSFPTNLLEYKFSVRIPNSIDESITNNADCYYYGFDWIENIGCVDDYIFLMEEFENSSCLSNNYRTISVNQSDSLTTVNSCYNSCEACTD